MEHRILHTTMEPGRRHQIERVYHEGLTRPAGERAAFLAEACRGDEALRSAVESLLDTPASAAFAPRTAATAAQMNSDSGTSALTGRQLGVYRILELIGAGGMGEVYRAHDTTLHRDVAVKVLPPSFARDPDRIGRFDREARLLASLNHPNVEAIHGVEEWDGTRALILELVEGDTLAQRIVHGLDVETTLRLARQIAEGLEGAHEKGVIHRDLKPGNIKVTPDGRIKVLDFGLAKALRGDAAGVDLSQSADTSLALTEEGTLLGTAAYMSPEQVRGEPVDKRADIWAFGCVLYEMLTGRTVFGGATGSDILAGVLRSEPDWNLLPAVTPHGVRRLVRRCLEKDSRQRLHDIADARIELDDAGAHPPASEPGPARARRSPLMLSLGGAAIVGLIVAVAWWQGGRTGAVPRNPLADARFQRLTSFEASELDAAISPDGRFVVFLSNREGPYDAWVTQVGTGAFTNLTKGALPYILNDEIRNVGFTADNEVVLVTEPPDASGRVARNYTYALPLTGGTMRRYLDSGVELVWSADGSRVAYHESGPGDPIFVADRNARDGRQIYIAAPGIHSHYLTWSPDDRFIYFAHGVPPDEMDIWRIPSGGGTTEQLTFHNADVAYPAFVDGRTLIYRAVDEEGAGPWLYAIDVEHPEPRRVTLGVEQYLSVAAGAGGRRLVATVSNPTSGLWTVPITDGIAAESSATQVALPNVRALSPRFGADAIWYLSSDGGVTGLWCLSDGTPREIWKPGTGGLTVPPAVSADGRLIALLARRQGRMQLYVLSTDGPNVRALAESLDVRDAPTWSPDGQWIGVATGDRLLKVPVDGGSPVLLVAGPARIPLWSPDGRFILYSESIEGGPGYPVKAVTPEGEPFPAPAFAVRRNGDRYRVMPDGRQVVCIVGDYGRQDFWLVDLEGGARRQLTSLQPGFSIQGFDISADGARILFDRFRENSDVVLIDLPPVDGSPVASN